jgi:hypothetical protein
MEKKENIPKKTPQYNPIVKKKSLNSSTQEEIKIQPEKKPPVRSRSKVPTNPTSYKKPNSPSISHKLADKQPKPILSPTHTPKFTDKKPEIPDTSVTEEIKKLKEKIKKNNQVSFI